MRDCIVRQRRHLHVLTARYPKPCHVNLYWRDEWANAAVNAKGGTVQLCPNLRPRTGAWCGNLGGSQC